MNVKKEIKKVVTTKEEIVKEKIVKISREEILNSTNVLETIKEKLSAAGIPVINGRSFDKVSSGTLLTKEDNENNCYVYHWKP